MSHQSFRGLGVSAPVVDALAARSIHEPFSIQTLVLPGRARGPRRAGEIAHRLGEDVAFALPIVERASSRATVAERPRARPDP